MQHEIYSSNPIHCIITCGYDCINNIYDYGFKASVVFSLLTFLVAFYQIIMHYANFNNPYFQSKIIIILLLPPIYCITSTLSFISLKYTVYLNLGRDFYESLGLFAFIYLMFSFIAYDSHKDQLDQRKVYQIMKSQCSQVSHQFPCFYFQKPYQFSSWRKAKFFNYRCKRTILYYIIAKIITTIFIALIYPNYQIRQRNHQDWDYVVYNYVNIVIYWIIAISSYFAYYYLNLFYNCLKNPLKPFKPDLKFFALKATIFFIYWQQIWLIIFENNIMSCFDKQATSFDQRNIMYALEDVLICLEMFLLVFVFVQAYSYQNYKLNSVNRTGSFSYVMKDIITIMLSELSLLSPKKIGFTQRSDQTQTQLQTITIKSKANKDFNANINVPISSRLKQNYF